MANLVLSPEEFAKEIKVVMEERRWRTDDRPHSLVYEQLMATALTAHPYRTPVIGWMNDLENMSVDDTRALVRAAGMRRTTPRWWWSATWRRRRCSRWPSNISARSPRKTLPARKPQDEPPQRGMKRLTVKAPAELPYVLMAYHVPVCAKPAKDWEPYALDMLEGVLDGNDAARLTATLVKTDRLATSAGASYDGISRGPAFFYLDGTPAAGTHGGGNGAGPAARSAARGRTRASPRRNSTASRRRSSPPQVFQRDSMFSQARADRLAGDRRPVRIAIADLHGSRSCRR